MNWTDKFKIIQSYLEVNEDIEQDFYIKPNGASAGVIAKLKSDFRLSRCTLRRIQRIAGYHSALKPVEIHSCYTKAGKSHWAKPRVIVRILKSWQTASLISYLM